MTSRTGTDHGFTLIEVSLVIVILALMLALAVPRFTGTFNRLSLDETVRRLVTTVQYARAQAVVLQAEVDLVMSLDQPEYSLALAAAPGVDSAMAEGGLGLDAVAYQREGGYVDRSPGWGGEFGAPAEEPQAFFEPVTHTLPNPVHFAEVETIRDGLLVAGVATVRFYPNGTCDPFAVLIRHPNWGEIAMEFDPMTGRAFPR